MSASAAKASDSLGSLSDQFNKLQKEMANPGGGTKTGGLSAEFDKLQKSLPKGDQIHANFLNPNFEKENSEAFAGIMSGADAASEKLAGLKQAWAAVGAEMQFVAVIATALAVALGAAAAMAIRLTQEKDQLRATFDALNGAGTGGELLDELEDLSRSLPFTADKVNEWGKSLLSAGIKGDALKTSIKAIAAATAIMKEAGGQAAEALIKRFALAAETGEKITINKKILKELSGAGILADDLAKALGVSPAKLSGMTVAADKLGDAMKQALIAKGAGALKQLGNSWETISAKLREGFEDAFEDLGELVGPFMAELQSLASEFYSGSIAGTDWKDAIKAALTGAFTVAKEFVNFVHRGFLHAQIAVLQFRIAIKPVTSVLGELRIGAAGTWTALYLLKGTLIVLAVIFGVLAAAVLIAAIPFIIVGLAILGVVRGVQYLVGVIGGVIDNFGNLKAAAFEAGTGVITGLGNAIQSGAAWVIAIAAGVATGIIGAITGPLKIKSPSRVMMQIGAYTTEGLAMGIDAGAPDVAAAARGAAGSAVGGAAGGAASATGGKGGVTINIHEGAIVIHEGGDARALTLEALASVLEEAALQAGLA